MEGKEEGSGLRVTLKTKENIQKVIHHNKRLWQPHRHLKHDVSAHFNTSLSTQQGKGSCFVLFKFLAFTASLVQFLQSKTAATLGNTPAPHSLL